MKKLLLLFGVALFSVAAFAQPADDRVTYAMPIVDGKVTFSRVFEIEGETADQIFAGARIAVVDYFTSAKYISQLKKARLYREPNYRRNVDPLEDAIQFEDRFHHLLIVKGIGPRADTINHCGYTVRIATKDGRCKVEVVDLVYVTHARTFGSIFVEESIREAESLSVDDSFNKKGNIRAGGDGYIRRVMIETKDHILDQICSGIERATKYITSTKDDEW